jgi:hypothetical protein
MTLPHSDVLPANWTSESGKISEPVALQQGRDRMKKSKFDVSPENDDSPKLE